MSGDEKSQKKSFSIFIYKDKVYIPSRGKFDSGLRVHIDPVHIITIQKINIVNTILNVLASKIEQLPGPKTREEWLARKDPVLAATGARSWKELAKTGYSYSIDWPEHHVRIDMSRLDKQGRWEFDPNKTRILPPDTPLEDIVDIILKDLESRNDQISSFLRT